MSDVTILTPNAAEAQQECDLFSPDEWALINTPEPAAPEPAAPLTRAQIIARDLRAWAEEKAKTKPVLRQIETPDPAPQPPAPPKQPLFVDVNEYLAELRASLPKHEPDTRQPVLQSQFMAMTPGEDYIGDDYSITWEKIVPTKLDRLRRKWRELEVEKASLERQEVRSTPEQMRLKLLPVQIEKARRAYFDHANNGETAEDRQRHEIDVWRAGDGRAEYNASRRTVRQNANSGYVDLSELAPEAKEDRAAEQRYISNTRARLTKQGLPESDIEARIQDGLEKRRAKQFPIAA